MPGDGENAQGQLAAFIATAEGEFRRLNSLIKDLADQLALEKAGRFACEKRLDEVEQKSAEFEKKLKVAERRRCLVGQKIEGDICVEEQMNEKQKPLDVDATAGHEHQKSDATKFDRAAKGSDNSSVYEEVERLRRKTGRSRALPHSPVRSRSSSASSETRREAKSRNINDAERYEMKKFKFKIPGQFKSCDGSDASEFLDWMMKIERVASASGWSSSYKCWLVANLVDGRAAHVLDCCEDKVKSNWKKLRRKLVKKLVPSQHFEHLRNELRCFHQSNNDVTAYVREFREKTRKAYANNTTGKYEEDIVRMFIHGLNSEDLRLKTLEQQCESLDEVTEYVLNVVVLQELAKQSSSPRKPTFACQADPSSSPSAPDHHEQFAYFDSSPHQSSRSIQCFKCGEYGHIKANCPSREIRELFHDCGQDEHGSWFQRQWFEFDKSRQSRDIHQMDSGFETFSATTYDDRSYSNSGEPRGPACYVTVAPFSRQPGFDLLALVPCELGTNGSPATALVDNGSSCNILNEDFYMRWLMNEPLQNSGVKTINSLSGHAMNVIGKIGIWVGIGQPSVCRFKTIFYVVSELPFDVIIGAEGMYDGYLRTDIRNKTVCARVGSHEVCVPFLSTTGSQYSRVPSRAFEHCSKPRAGSLSDSWSHSRRLSIISRNSYDSRNKDLSGIVH